jgi:phosphatidylinositol-3-phosphatase
VPKNCFLAYFCVLLLTAVACGCGSSAGTSTGSGAGTGTAAVQHVAIVVFENQDYQSVVGSGSMPFLNGLIQQNSLATQFFANVHPSIGDYFMMTTGEVVSTDNSFAGTFGGENVTTALNGANQTWKMYAESLPAAGYVGGDQYPYIQHHNPFGFFDNVRNDSAQRNNIVPLTQLASDTGGSALPNYLFIVPNNLHNGHDCPAGGSNCPLSAHLSAIDSWLQSNVAPLLGSSAFAGSGILIITFDESASDNTFGGGRIATVLVGGKVKSGFQSTTMYQFPSLLRFSLKLLGVTAYPGQAAQAPDMDEFLK